VRVFTEVCLCPAASRFCRQRVVGNEDAVYGEAGREPPCVWASGEGDGGFSGRKHEGAWA
jgi:hypothetical protein